MVPFTNLTKTRSRLQPRGLKIGRMKAYPKFHKIYKFENNVIRNDVILMSFPKLWKNADPQGTSKITHR